MNTVFLDTNRRRTLPQWLLWGSCKNLHDCISTLVISQLLFLPLHRLQTCLGFLLLLPLLVVVCQIQPSNVVEIQQRSPLSNNTWITTRSWMIILQGCLFKPWRTMNMLLCFSSAFWIIHNKNCISVSFRCWEITFRRVYTSIWDTLYKLYLIFNISVLLSTIYLIQDHMRTVSQF